MEQRLKRLLLIVIAAVLWLYVPPPDRFRPTPARAQEQESIRDAVEAVLFEGDPSDGRLGPELRSAALHLAGEVVDLLSCREISTIPSPNYRCSLDTPTGRRAPRED